MLSFWANIWWWWWWCHAKTRLQCLQAPANLIKGKSMRALCCASATDSELLLMVFSTKLSIWHSRPRTTGYRSIVGCANYEHHEISLCIYKQGVWNMLQIALMLGLALIQYYTALWVGYGSGVTVSASYSTPLPCPQRWRRRYLWSSLWALQALISMTQPVSERGHKPARHHKCPFSQW